MATNITTGKAYVTFLAGQVFKTKYPLVVAILPGVYCEILASQGCIVREIEPVYPPENQTQFAIAYRVANYSNQTLFYT
ncbi:galactinol synthase 1 [Quercus suber]|uniref:Galactinol synthase 1 n=1 Tax=Quercus suber TaxID=58331 RepID=A0AAW0JKT9_QUESU